MNAPCGALNASFQARGLMTHTKFGVPGNLQPSAGIMLWALHVGRDQEALVLTKDLRRPVPIKRDRTVDEAVSDGAATGKIKCSAFILAIPGFDASAA